MRFSAKTVYALGASIELARRSRLGETVVTLNDLAETCDIPVNFLVTVLAALRKSGIVESLRGKDGGYRLMRDAGDVSLGDVVRSTESPESPSQRRDGSGADSIPAYIEGVRKRAEAEAFKALDSLSLDDAANAVSGRAGEMYYI